MGQEGGRENLVWGNFQLLALQGMYMIILSRPLWVFMVLTMTLLEEYNGMS
jgi:hypothetical protein